MPHRVTWLSFHGFSQFSQANSEIKYCNGFDQCDARQRLCKHGATRKNRGGYVSRVRRDVTQRRMVVM
jgi:hypothetical protein